MRCPAATASRVVSGLSHIRWLGGGTGAGKTTVARQLAQRSGLPVYSADAAIAVHSAKLSAAAAPLLERFRSMSMDERWVQRDPREMYRTFPWFHGEGFDLLIPTPTFRQAAFAARDRSEAFWLQTTDPARALDNLLARDQIFTAQIASAATHNRLRTIAIDGTRPIDATAATIATQFGL